ncbi:MAG: hypothetical protein MRY32_04420 [Rickettsiales bacterium]|nr:hypothetical protein [Rickettsiales bacterium]
MAFSSKRGRPKSERPVTDYGTPELIMKRACDQTAESIDLCLARNLITNKQHWCGMHLRWLYTLRYGAPSVSAASLDELSRHHEVVVDDAEWRASREREWDEAVLILQRVRANDMVQAICIYNERPHCLRRECTALAARNPSMRRLIHHQINALSTGLDELRQEWGA